MKARSELTYFAPAALLWGGLATLARKPLSFGNAGVSNLTHTAATRFVSDNYRLTPGGGAHGPAPPAPKPGTS